MSVVEVFLVRSFLHLDWIQINTEYLSVFSPNAGKYGTENTKCGHFSRSGLYLKSLIYIMMLIKFNLIIKPGLFKVLVCQWGEGGHFCPWRISLDENMLERWIFVQWLCTNGKAFEKIYQLVPSFAKFYWRQQFFYKIWKSIYRFQRVIALGRNKIF